MKLRVYITIYPISCLSGLFKNPLCSPCLCGESSSYSSILAYLRTSRFYVAVAFVGCDDDAFWGDLGLGYFEGCGDGAVLEEAFALAEGDGDYHQLEAIDEIVFEQRLEHISAAHNVQIGAVGLF